MNDSIPINVGESIRRLREAHNLSMRALAKASGLSANALSMIERGKTSPSISTLYKLADALGVPVTATIPFRRISPGKAGKRAIEPAHPRRVLQCLIGNN
jgi:transcriptional regulator with XRE-family HTH domain